MIKRPTPSDAPTSKLTPEGLRAGRLGGVSFPELLAALCGAGGTGVLCVAHRGVKKNIYIERGRVVFAASEDPDDRLGILLLKQNAITLHELETALKQRSTGRRIGTLLVEADSITPEQLTRGVIDQVKGIVLDLFVLDDAEYRFTEGPLPTREVITIDLPTNALVLEGIKRTRSLNRIRRRIGGPTSVWGLSEGWDDALEGLSLNEGERLLLERLTQGEASLDDLCSDVFLSSFEICQLLWALKVLGAVEELGVRDDQPGGHPYRNAPRDHGFLEFLLQLCRVKETGVLYARLGARERSFHLREGECVFATSNDPEDGLVNFLLRRGVISLRDRDETVNRLLSNKRVGTILLELGVIDDADLHDMVRQQLIEVVYDTFRWVGGEFSFVSGPLPSIEPITLDQSLESLVVAGLRRVTSWSRIRKGCGGLRSILALTPEYLDVLDAMHAGVEEWEVVNALRTPRSPLEVCHLSQLSNFRVCQILWAMKILGGIEVIQAEQPEDWEQPEARFFSDAVPAAVGSPETDRSPEDEPAVGDELPRLVEELRAEELGAEELGEEDETMESGSEPPGAAADAAPEADEESWEDRFQEADETAGSESGGHDPAPPVDIRPVPSPLSAELDMSTRTVRMSRDEVESALRGSVRQAGDTAFEQPEPAPEPLEVEHGEVAEPLEVEDAEVAELLEVENAEDAEHAEEPPSSEPEIEIEILADPPEADEVETEPAAPAWDPPADLDSLIARFNAQQRVIYRTVRSEVGAGAANFIRSCCEGGPQAEAIWETELHSDGSWDAEGLRSAVIEKRIEDPGYRYRSLISREIEILRGHIGEARALELQSQVERVDAGVNP